MSACEQCWSDAVARARFMGGSVADHYRDLLATGDDHDQEHGSEPEVAEATEEPTVEPEPYDPSYGGRFCPTGWAWDAHNAGDSCDCPPAEEER